MKLSRKIFVPEGTVDTRVRLSFQSSLAADAIKVTIFDAQGRKCRALTPQGAGTEYWAEWDGRTESGTLLAPGIYIYEVKAGGVAHRGAVVMAR